jgi:hypothetical protein
MFEFDKINYNKLYDFYFFNKNGWLNITQKIKGINNLQMKGVHECSGATDQRYVFVGQITSRNERTKKVLCCTINPFLN